MTLYEWAPALIVIAVGLFIAARDRCSSRPRKRPSVSVPVPALINVISVEYLAPLSEDEVHDHIRRLQFARMESDMARRFGRPAPKRVEA